MAYNPLNRSVVSIDTRGMIEYWSADEPYSLPTKGVAWQYKSDTSLYDFVKQKTSPDCLTFNHAYTHFATMGVQDRIVRVWAYATAKVIRKYDESLQTTSEMQQAGTSLITLDNMEFGRRMANEKDIEKAVAQENAAETPSGVHIKCIWDETDHFLLYPTVLGIKGIFLIMLNKDC